MEVFLRQFAVCSPYRRYCESLGATDATVAAFEAIPFVSTVAFKHVAFSCDPGAREAREFLTSGTTAGRDRRGRHIVANPQLYRASAMKHMRTMLFPDGLAMRTLAMHPTAELMPESSLSAMISWAIEEFSDGPSRCVAGRSGIDCDGALEFMRAAQADGAPICIFGTTAAFAELVSHLKRRAMKITLPAGSRLMDTGGPKGQSTPLSARQVVELASIHFGIAPEFVINEYGMTELCSQLYDATSFNSALDTSDDAERWKIAPPWVRPLTIDPVTMRRTADGEPGMLAFFDLANANSVSAVVTEDFGIVRGDRVRVVGRAAAAESRGCALAIGQFRESAVSGAVR